MPHNNQRTHAGAVDEQTTATGSDGLPIGRGDLIQTRKNDTSLGVANRQLWVVQHVADDGAPWVVEAGGDRKHERTVRLLAAYVTGHTHLPYASTSYGVQGITVPASHMILTDAMSGAAVYVGMTRGTDENVLHVVSESLAEARQQFIDAVERDRADRGLTDATQQAAEAVRGLVDDGPVKIVTTEIVALAAQAEHAEQRAVLWRQAADALNELYAGQRDERDQAGQAADTATRQLERVRAEVAAPLTEQASAALGERQTADTAQQTARERLRMVGRFGKRRATIEHETAQTLAQDAATEQHETAANAVRKTLEPDDLPRVRIYARIFGANTVANSRAAYLTARPHANAEYATRTAIKARAEIEALRALTPTEAVARINETRAAEQAAREGAERALRERQRQRHPSRSYAHDSGPHHDGPVLGR